LLPPTHHTHHLDSALRGCAAHILSSIQYVHTDNQYAVHWVGGEVGMVGRWWCAQPLIHPNVIPCVWMDSLYLGQLHHVATPQQHTSTHTHTRTHTCIPGKQEHPPAMTHHVHPPGNTHHGPTPPNPTHTTHDPIRMYQSSNPQSTQPHNTPDPITNEPSPYHPTQHANQQNLYTHPEHHHIHPPHNPVSQTHHTHMGPTS